MDNNASSTTPSSTTSVASTTVYTQSCANGNAVIGSGSLEEPTETLLDSAIPPTPATALPAAIHAKPRSPPAKTRSPPAMQTAQTPATRFPFDIIVPPNEQHTPRGMEMKEVWIASLHCIITLHMLFDKIIKFMSWSRIFSVFF